MTLPRFTYKGKEVQKLKGLVGSPQEFNLPTSLSLCAFEMGFCYKALNGLELTIETRSASKLHQSSCLCLLNAGTTGVCHIWLCLHNLLEPFVIPVQAGGFDWLGMGRTGQKSGLSLWRVG